jgi:uncharacterized protein involved in exopolysaccharide biosynthesis
MINKYKNIIIIAVIIGLALIAYSFLKPDPTAESLLVVTERQNSTQALGDEITAAINQINSLRLDDSIFKDPIMAKLKDHNQKINPEDVGRPDPFAPITSKGSQGSVSTTTLSINQAPVTTTKATTTPANPMAPKPATSTLPQ